MCGIFGVFDREHSPLNEDLAVKMGRVLDHRGPDDRGHIQVDGM